MVAVRKMRSDFKNIYSCHSTVILVILFCSNRQMMLPESGPGFIVKLYISILHGFIDKLYISILQEK